MHSQGALPLKLCTRKLFHAPSQHIEMLNCSKNVHTPGTHLRKLCTRPWKCAHRVQGAPLISDTGILHKPTYSMLNKDVYNLFLSLSMCHNMTLYYTPVLEQTMITESILGCSICAILALIDSAGMLRTIPSPLLSAGCRKTPEVGRAMGFNCRLFLSYFCRIFV